MNKLIIPSKTERLIQKNEFLLTRGHDFVEIGGVKWATCNIGAKKPTDPGFYFQWGDTKGYTAEQIRNGEKCFNWRSYLFNCNTFMLLMNKYNVTDGKTMLDISDDAVHAAWGGAWRMPTREDFAALANAATMAWTNNYQGSGVAGFVWTDNTDSSKELFFPSTGYCFESYIESLKTCFFWTISSNPLNVIESNYIYFVSSNTNFIRSYINYGGYCNRCVGFPIRGIIKTK